MKTRRFWEKTRETPDQSDWSDYHWSSPIGVNAGPGQFFSTLPHHDAARSKKGSVPRVCMREVIDRQIKNRFVRPLPSTHDKVLANATPRPLRF
jgi:hypothetical protein